MFSVTLKWPCLASHLINMIRLIVSLEFICQFLGGVLGWHWDWKQIPLISQMEAIPFLFRVHSPALTPTFTRSFCTRLSTVPASKALSWGVWSGANPQRSSAFLHLSFPFLLDNENKTWNWCGGRAFLEGCQPFPWVLAGVEFHSIHVSLFVKT